MFVIFIPNQVNAVECLRYQTESGFDNWRKIRLAYGRCIKLFVCGFEVRQELCNLCCLIPYPYCWFVSCNFIHSHLSMTEYGHPDSQAPGNLHHTHHSSRIFYFRESLSKGRCVFISLFRLIMAIPRHLYAVGI